MAKGTVGGRTRRRPTLGALVAGAAFSLAVSASAAGEADPGPVHPDSVVASSVHASLAARVPLDPALWMGPPAASADAGARQASTGAARDGSTGSAGLASTGPDAVSIRSSIEKANVDWLSALRRDDAEAMAAFYAPDASLFPPGTPSLDGPGAIVAFFQERRRAGLGDPSLRTLEVVPMGDVAYEVGVYGTRFDAGGSDLVADAGRYFAIWKVQADGSLRYQVGIWTSNRSGNADLDPAPALQATRRPTPEGDEASRALAARALAAGPAGR